MVLTILAYVFINKWRILITPIHLLRSFAVNIGIGLLFCIVTQCIPILIIFPFPLALILDYFAGIGV